MTFAVNRKLLATELSLLQSVISKYVTMPILDTVRFEVRDGLRLTASSIDVTLTTEIPLPGLVNEPESWCVPITPLARLVALFEKDEVTFEQTDTGRIKVQCGRSKHLLPRYNAGDFPEPDAVDAETVTIKGELLSAILNHTAFAVFAATGDVRTGDQKFTGLHWTLADGQLTIAATNKLRLAIARTPLAGSDFAVITPQQVVPALRKLSTGEMEIGVSANGNLMLVRSAGRLLTMRLLVDKPLDWLSLFPAKYDHTAEVETSVLADSLKRALVTSDDKPSFVINGLKWLVSADELQVESRDGDQGKSEETVPIVCPSLNGNSVTLGMNGTQVIDYLGLDVAGEKTRVEITEGSHVIRLSPVAAREFQYEYLVNTINLRW
jgi:DNA polymerase III sliding clamp (beta) subunit (PCNA family)